MYTLPLLVSVSLLLDFHVPTHRLPLTADKDGFTRSVYVCIAPSTTAFGRRAWATRTCSRTSPTAMSSHTELPASTPRRPSVPVASFPVSATALNDNKDGVRLRERINLAPPGKRTVGFADRPHGDAPRRRLWPQQAERIVQFQQRWERIKADLPPQLSRKHSMQKSP